jgi:hypothetical protein
LTNIPAVPENGIPSEIREAEMNVTGGCFCGHVTYTATVDPERVYICHCTDCQRHSGAAYGVVVAVVDQQFQLLTGKLKTHDKIADSGTVRALAFCPECGTRIHATSPGRPSDMMGLRLGTVDQRDKLPPTGQAFCGSAQDWVDDLRGISKL